MPYYRRRRGRRYFRRRGGYRRRAYRTRRNYGRRYRRRSRHGYRSRRSRRYSRKRYSRRRRSFRTVGIKQKFLDYYARVFNAVIALDGELTDAQLAAMTPRNRFRIVKFLQYLGKLRMPMLHKVIASFVMGVPVHNTRDLPEDRVPHVRNCTERVINVVWDRYTTHMAPGQRLMLRVARRARRLERYQQILAVLGHPAAAANALQNMAMAGGTPVGTPVAAPMDVGGDIGGADFNIPPIPPMMLPPAAVDPNA